MLQDQNLKQVEEITSDPGNAQGVWLRSACFTSAFRITRCTEPMGFHVSSFFACLVRYTFSSLHRCSLGSQAKVQAKLLRHVRHVKMTNVLRANPSLREKIPRLRIFRLIIQQVHFC